MQPPVCCCDAELLAALENVQEWYCASRSGTQPVQRGCNRDVLVQAACEPDPSNKFAGRPFVLGRKRSRDTRVKPSRLGCAGGST